MNVTVPNIGGCEYPAVVHPDRVLTGSAISILIFAGAWNYWGRGQFRIQSGEFNSRRLRLCAIRGEPQARHRDDGESTTEIGMENYAVATS